MLFRSDEYVRHFAGIFAGKMGKKIDAVDPGYLDLLKRHAWRGNVRELRNVVERSMIMAEGTTLRVGDLPIEFQRENGSDGNDAPPTSLDAIEKQHIAKILSYTGGNKTETARLLGIGVTTLYRKIDEYGL